MLENLTLFLSSIEMVAHIYPTTPTTDSKMINQKRKRVRNVTHSTKTIKKHPVHLLLKCLTLRTAHSHTGVQFIQIKS